MSRHVPLIGARSVRLAREPRYWAAVLAVGGLYVGAGKLGIDLPVAHGVITPVWAPTGIALVSLLLFGRRLWPAIYLGALLANVTSGAPLWLAAAIAVGNTLEAVTGSYLLTRVGFHLALDRVRDVLMLVVCGAGLSTLVSATNGVSLLYATDRIHNYGAEWLLWWFGDGAGDLLVAPLLLVWVAYRQLRPTRAQIVEGAALAAGLAGASAVVFFAGAWRYPYLVFPFLIWAPLRFRQLGAATASFLVGAIATAGVVEGHVPIGDSSTQGVQILQALVSVVAISMLIVGATLAEREAVTKALENAQELTHIGSWEWDIPRDNVHWSDELFRIYGLEPQSIPVNYGTFLERVHPDDRPLVDAAVQRAYSDHEAFDFEHRIVLPDGDERLMHARGRVELDEAGRPARMVGTGQDITERRKLERLREGILTTVSHELRTPLTSVLGFALTLKERRAGLSDEDSRKMIDHIADQAARLEGLLIDLLDLDRYRRGLLGPTLEPVELARLVERVATGRRDETRALEIEADQVVAVVDAAKVERIVDNLLSNAFKHTPPGTRVSLAVRRRGRDVLITVDDAGQGVPPESRTSIFEVFNRGHRPMDGTPGAGIGLSIVAQFAALHNGKAWVEERPGGGASFRVLLPDCVRP